MKYKAFLCDVDGTLLYNDGITAPSPYVIKTIQLANKYTHFGLATSRPRFLLKDLLKVINLSGPSIINAGAEIIDFTENKILINFPIERSILQELTEIMLSLNLDIHIDDGKSDVLYSGYIPSTKILKIFVLGITVKKVDLLLNKTAHMRDITIHQTPSWKKNALDVFFTSRFASKENGVSQIIKLLGITKEEIIGIGDGHNDISLLKACGLKIAMGNAHEDVKKMADFIVPNVENDGVAYALNKFILTQE